MRGGDGLRSRGRDDTTQADCPQAVREPIGAKLAPWPSRSITIRSSRAAGRRLDSRGDWSAVRAPLHRHHEGRPEGARGPRPQSDGQLPILTDGEAVVTESAAISLDLADRYAAGRLAPELDDPQRAAYLRGRCRAVGRSSQVRWPRSGVGSSSRARPAGAPTRRCSQRSRLRSPIATSSSATRSRSPTSSSAEPLRFMLQLRHDRGAALVHRVRERLGQRPAAAARGCEERCRDRRARPGEVASSVRGEPALAELVHHVSRLKLAGVWRGGNSLRLSTTRAT